MPSPEAHNSNSSGSSTPPPGAASSGSASPRGTASFAARVLRILRPSHQHSVFSATVLLMAAVMLSRIIGYLREMYIAWAFGAGPQTDAYVAAFQLPDFLLYILAGGTASITFISIYTRHTTQSPQRVPFGSAQGKLRQDSAVSAPDSGPSTPRPLAETTGLVAQDDRARETATEAQRVFDATITIMTAVVCLGTILLEIWTPQLVRLIFPKFGREQLELCVHLTRILLPGQIFFYAGGIVSAVLYSKRLFLYPALSPTLYTVFIIAGGVVGAKQFGISSLAYGALVGAVLGPFLINAIGAARGGLRYHFSFDWRNPGFREWVKLTIPLMLGVSLVSADDWILRYFASGGVGDIARLNYAKRLFAVPISILGQATGQASMPFFARLWEEGKRTQFADTVNQAVYRISAASFLASAWMMAAALPLIDLVYRRGHFTFQDSRATAVYFFWFSLSLALWAAQAQYARAFYAAGDTVTPMVASTIIVVASLPVYRALFHLYDVTGLAIASDIGILMHTVVLAWLLNRKKMVLLREVPWREVMKALATAVLAAAVSYGVAQIVVVSGRRAADLASLGLISTAWAIAVALGLWLTKSGLPRDLRRKKDAVIGAQIQPPDRAIEGGAGGVAP